MQIDKPLVSVIIAVKNGERYLSQAINSVLAQDYRPFEIIVVDGQSEDRTAQIAQSIVEVRYIWQTNKGISNAYNIGIDAASGVFIAFLSHDDLWKPDKLSIQVNHLIDNPHIQYTTAKVNFFLESSCSIPPGFRKELLDGDHVGHIMETLVVRKSLFNVIGKFNPNLSTAEDVDWFARAKDNNVPMTVIQIALLNKRIHDTNISLNIVDNNRNLLTALRQSIYRKRTN